ncbi:MAG TPA: 50S ribosomal protein L9 [Thermoanaerobaculia bacterium]|nr:50S ribosomal protein L9 [Thermoanaerobaculia bacterium]
MKIILTDEVRGLGRRGDVVDVKNGYARNFLLPQGLAFLANPANVRRLEEEKKRYDEKVLREKGVAEKVAAQMAGLRLTLVKKAGEGDVLYGSVTAGEIADQLAEKGIAVDRRRIELEEPIKRLGEHQVHVKLHRDVTVPITIEVQGAPTISAAAAS